MNKEFEPDKQFLERMEWQMASEYRRALLRGPSAERISLSRRSTVALVAIGIMLSGVAVIKAADLVRDSWRKKIEIARAETAVRLKETALGAAQELAGRMEGLFAKGMIAAGEPATVERAVQKADADLKKALLDLDEVRATGSAPRNELYAPASGNRDFVSARLEIERRDAEEELKRLESLAERTRRLVENNLASREELDLRQGEVAAQTAKINEIRNQMELRKQFIKGGVAAPEIEIQSRLAAAASSLTAARTKVESLQGRMERLAALESRGLVSSTEVRRLRAELEAAKIEMQFAALEKDALDNAR
jgi:multidrug resistance efflux pump